MYFFVFVNSICITCKIEQSEINLLVLSCLVVWYSSGTSRTRSCKTMWACVTGAKKGKTGEERVREREKPVVGAREGEGSLSFSPQSPLPFSLFPLSHVSTPVTQTKQCLLLLRICSRTHRPEVALHSSRKKSVIIIYTRSQNIILKPLHRAVGSPMSPHHGGLVSIDVEGCDFLGEVFSFDLFYTEAWALAVYMRLVIVMQTKPIFTRKSYTF